MGNWIGNSGGIGKVEGTFIDGTKTIKVTGYSGIQYNSFIKLKRNTTYVYSMMMKSSGSMIVNSSNPLHMWLNTSETGGQHLEKVISASGKLEANKWTKIWVVFETPNTQDVYYMKPFVYGIDTNTVYISKVQIEEGTKATDWTPAPEDVQASIDLKASKTDVYTKSETYSKTETDSAIKVAKDSIELGVKNTYETKSNVTTKVNEAINGIQVGSRNLMRDSKETVAFTNFTGGTNTTMFYRKVYLTPDLKAGDKISVSLTYKYKNITLVSGQEGNARLYVQGSGNVTGWSAGFNSSPNVISNITKGNTNELTLYQTYTFTLSEAQLSNQYFSVGLRTDYIKTGSLSVYEMKVEKGSKSTAWTPAPEDVQGMIDSKANTADVYTKSETYTKAQTDSAIKVAKDSINLGVSQTYETKSNVETKISSANTNTLNSAKSYADTKKNEAISSASADATSKINSAKSELNTAINKKANSTDVYKKSETYTKSETDSKINIAKDSINLGVSQTYETKTNVENKISTAVNNVQIGGRNLAYKETIKPFSSSTLDLTKYVKNGKLIVTRPTGTGDGGFYFDKLIKYKKNTKYIVHFYMTCTKYTIKNIHFHNGQKLVSTKIYIDDVYVGTIGTIDTSVFDDGLPHKVRMEYTTPSTLVDSSAGVNQTYFQPNKGLPNNTYTVVIEEFMVEEGTKTGSWTPAPEDIDSAIGTKANASDVYNKTEVYTKTETTSQINVAKNSITNTVAQTYLNKNDASNTYATKSSLTQTANNITASFKASGGFNLLKNSDAKNGSSYWVSNGGGLSITTAGVNPFIGEKEFKTTFPSGMAYYTSVRLKSNTDYVYEAWIYTNTAITSNSLTPLHFWCSSTADTSGQSQCTVIDYRQTLTVNAYTKVYVHFRTKSGNVFFKPFIYSSATSGMICVKQISLSEGTIESAWTPHPDEVYSGSTIIDANGVTINNGALTVKNKSGSTVLSGDSNGNLIFNGTAKSQSGDKWVGLDAGGITFQDSQKTEQVLRVGTSYFSSNRDLNGANFSLAQYGDFIRFSHIAKPDLTNGWSSSDAQYNFFDCWSSDQANGNTKFKKGINVYAPMYINNRIKFNYQGSTLFTNDILPATWNTVTGLLGVYGDNGAILGYQNGNNLNARIVVTEEAHPGTGDNIRSWGNWNCSGYTVHNGTFSGNHVNSYANTYTRTSAQTHCIEAEQKQVRVNFEDVQITEGKAILNLPRKYTGIHSGYIVSSIVKKGRGDVWVSEESENRFILEGTDDIKVNVEVVIKLEEASAYSLKTTDASQLCIDISTGQPIN